MDCVVRIQWITINLMMIWFLTKSETEECQEGFVNASSSVTSVGSSITILCSLKQSATCSKRGKSITINKENRIPQQTLYKDSNSISIQANNLTLGKIPFVCILDCGNKRTQICGIYIEVGTPPDQPKNVSCILYGEHGNITCTWEAGQDPYICTHYSLQLVNRVHSWIFNTSKKNSHTFDSQLLSINQDRDSYYTAIVNTSNLLGMTASAPLTFRLFDIVKPHPPTHLVIDFQNSSANKCTVSWQDDQMTRRFHIRYRSTNTSSWKMVEVINTKVYDLYDLTPFMEYEFQVSGKFHTENGKWSEWSTSVIKQTPEAVPTGKLDIWYKLNKSSNKTRIITLLWKKMSLSEARGEILHYEVKLQKLTSKITHTWFVEAIDTTVTTIAVSACSARGNSPPTYISIANVEGLPFPQNVLANASCDGRIFVSWKPPVKPAVHIDEYVVEWSESDNTTLHGIKWIKVPALKLSAILSENIKPNVCYHINVYALSENKAGMAAFTRGSSCQMAPLLGPEMSFELGKENSVLVSWKEIPTHKQMGCIISYRIYLQQQHFHSTTTFFVIPNENFTSQHEIKNLKPNVPYLIWMTGSTEKGESPKGNDQLIFINIENGFKDSVSIIIAASLIVAIGCACICCVQLGRQRTVSPILSIILPRWCSRPVPDPANSTWAKEYKSVKDKMRLLSNQLSGASSSCEEPETMEVEEIFTEKEPISFSDTFIPSSDESYDPYTQRAERNQWQSNDISVERELSGTTTSDDPSIYKCQVPCWYKAVVAEEPNHTQPFPECSVNPLVDMTVNYLPTNVLPASINCLEDGCDTECGFSPENTFSTPLFSFGGKLTLDAVKIDCSAFAQ